MEKLKNLHFCFPDTHNQPMWLVMCVLLEIFSVLTQAHACAFCCIQIVNTIYIVLALAFFFIRTTRVIWVKSGEGAAWKDLEVRENVANSGNLMCLGSVGESSGREEWDRQGWRGRRDQVLHGLECQAGKLSLSSGRWEPWKGISRGGA